MSPLLPWPPTATVTRTAGASSKMIMETLAMARKVKTLPANSRTVLMLTGNSWTPSTEMETLLAPAHGTGTTMITKGTKTPSEDGTTGGLRKLNGTLKTHKPLPDGATTGIRTMKPNGLQPLLLMAPYLKSLRMAMATMMRTTTTGRLRMVDGLNTTSAPTLGMMMKEIPTTPRMMLFTGNLKTKNMDPTALTIGVMALETILGNTSIPTRVIIAGPITRPHGPAMIKTGTSTPLLTISTHSSRPCLPHSLLSTHLNRIENLPFIYPMFISYFPHYFFFEPCLYLYLNHCKVSPSL